MRIERLSKKDKQPLKYLLQNSEKTPIEQKTDTGEIEYIDIDGEMIPVETGLYDVGQGEEPNEGEATSYIVCFEGNIAFSGGETELREYGVDSSDYDAVLLMSKDAVPITETSFIWYESEPRYKDGLLVDMDGDSITDSNGNKMVALADRVDVSSADYHVAKVIPSLGICRYLLKKVTN